MFTRFAYFTSIATALLVVAGPVQARLFIDGTPYCGQSLKIEQAPLIYTGPGWISQDGLTIYAPDKTTRSQLLALMLQAYRTEKKQECVAPALETLLKKSGLSLKRPNRLYAEELSELGIIPWGCRSDGFCR